MSNPRGSEGIWFILSLFCLFAKALLVVSQTTNYSLKTKFATRFATFSNGLEWNLGAFVCQPDSGEVVQMTAPSLPTEMFSPGRRKISGHLSPYPG